MSDTAEKAKADEPKVRQETAYVRVQFTDKDGVHEVDDKVTFDLVDTDTEEGVQRLYDYGIIAKKPTAKTGQAQG